MEPMGTLLCRTETACSAWVFFTACGFHFYLRDSTLCGAGDPKTPNPSSANSRQQRRVTICVQEDNTKLSCALHQIAVPEPPAPASAKDWVVSGICRTWYRFMGFCIFLLYCHGFRLGLFALKNEDSTEGSEGRRKGRQRVTTSAPHPHRRPVHLPSSIPAVRSFRRKAGSDNKLWFVYGV